MANTTENDWDESDPSASGLVSAGDDQIRLLRASTRNRLEKEHILPAAGNLGGEHLAGSAKIYSQTATPTKRPDSVNDAPGTTLDATDKGRMWYDETTRQLKRWDGTAWVSCPESYAKLSYTVAAGVAGGTLTQNTWNTRPINTEDNDADSIVSIAANQFTLGAGKYRIEVKAAAYTVNSHQLRVRNITDGTTTLVGLLGLALSTGQFDMAQLAGEFTITGTKAFEIQHNCETTKTTQGMGTAGTFTDAENSVHTIIEIRKLAS